MASIFVKSLVMLKLKASRRFRDFQLRCHGQNLDEWMLLFGHCCTSLESKVDLDNQNNQANWEYSVYSYGRLWCNNPEVRRNTGLVHPISVEDWCMLGVLVGGLDAFWTYFIIQAFQVKNNSLLARQAFLPTLLTWPHVTYGSSPNWKTTLEEKFDLWEGIVRKAMAELNRISKKAFQRQEMAEALRAVLPK